MKVKIVARPAGIWVSNANINDRCGGMTTTCERSRRNTSSQSSSEPRCRKKRHMVPWVRTLLQDYHIPCQHQRAIQETHIHEPHPSILRSPLVTISANNQFTTNSTCTTTSSPLLMMEIFTIRVSSRRRTRLTSRLRAKCTSMTFLLGKTPRHPASAHIIHRQSQPV